MDFKSGMINSNSKTRDGLRVAIIKYLGGLFYAELSDKTRLDVDSSDFASNTTLYSKPNNNKLEAWTISNATIKPEHYVKVSKYWSTIKPEMKVKGIIKDNVFIIKKYNV